MPLRGPVSQLKSLAPRRICIIKPSALGDVVQSLPLVPALRRRYPDAAIHWVINRDFAPLLEDHPDLAEVIPFDRRGSWRNFVRLLRDLRRRDFDLVFDLQGLARSALMTLATGARCRIGMQTAREGSSWACHGTLPDTGWQIPAHRRVANVIAALEVEPSPTESGLHIPPAARTWAQSRLQALPRPILAIHAGAGWETKRWPAEKFAEIARRFGGSIVTVGSRGEAPLAAPIIAAVSSAGNHAALDLAGLTSLPQLAAVLEQVDLVLSNDSGPMHLAAAAGTPVVGVFTCTSPILSGPAGMQHQLIATSVPCAASYCKHCPQQGPLHLACLEELSVDRVWQAVQRVCGQVSPVRHSA
jgi:lipopolysaccharide heptosyltransferase I